jgi:hypothetical protein
VTRADARIGIAIGATAIVFGVRCTKFYGLGPASAQSRAPRLSRDGSGRSVVDLGAYPARHPAAALLICWRSKQTEHRFLGERHGEQKVVSAIHGSGSGSQALRPTATRQHTLESF